MARIARKTKRIMCILFCCVLVMAHMGTSRKVRAEALPEVASGSTTIADIVLTYYSTVGAGISNIEFINKLSKDLGTNFGTIESFAEKGLLLHNETTGAWEPVSELVTAIENTSAYQSLGLDQIFNVSAQEAAAGGGLAASGAATLAGAAGGVASIGMLPLFAGVTASYWAGIGAGTLIAHLMGLYDDAIGTGVPMTDLELLSNVPAGGGSFILRWSKDGYQQDYGNIPVIGMRYLLDDTHYYYNIIGNGERNTSYNFIINSSGSNQTVQRTTNNVGFVSVNTASGNTRYSAFPVINYSSQNDYNNALSNFQDGTYKIRDYIYSPDIIGPNGNQQAEYDSENQKYTVPDFKPQIDPGTEAAKPISVEDWLNFANSVHNNNSQVDPLPDNARLFQDMIDALKIGLPSPGPNPNPNPNPDPNPNPNPTPVPDPDYGDPNPDQPDWQDPTEVPDPVDTGNPWRLPDLSKKFPFCIPWDIGKMFGKLKVNAREAPHIQWRFNPPGTPVDYTFDLDLEDYEEVASLLRSLELIAFIVGLAFATRYLIGAT